MKYLCLIYENEKNWETMPPADSEAIMNEYFVFTDDIRKNGKYVAGEALQPTETATTVRVRNGGRFGAEHGQVGPVGHGGVQGVVVTPRPVLAVAGDDDRRVAVHLGRVGIQRHVGRPVGGDVVPAEVHRELARLYLTIRHRLLGGERFRTFRLVMTDGTTLDVSSQEPGGEWAIDRERRLGLVDWKTGNEAADPLQLAIYRLAWAELHDVPLEQVRAAFYYVRSGDVVHHVHPPQVVVEVEAVQHPWPVGEQEDVVGQEVAVTVACSPGRDALDARRGDGGSAPARG